MIYGGFRNTSDMKLILGGFLVTFYGVIDDVV